jgi:LysM domain-containing protein
MSVMSTGRRPGAAVRRLSPEDVYLRLRRPSAAGSQPTGGRRAGRARLRLVPPLPAGPAEKRPPAPPRGRTPASADARVPAPRAGSAPPARAPMSPPAAVTAPARVAARPRVAGPAQGVAPAPGVAPARPARVVRPAHRPAHRPAGHGRVRLTRRGRLVVWALAALTAAAVLIPVWLLAAGGAQAANHGLPPAAVHAGLRQVVVRPGQTLWSIAMAAEPAADPRVVTQEIIQVNALSSQVLVPGESLWVPAN